MLSLKYHPIINFFILTILISYSSYGQNQNVLLITIDDLNTYLTSYGSKTQAIAPNIDSLAKSGTVFLNAHANYPSCNPSRVSFLTGLHPITTKITTNHQKLREENPQSITIFNYLKENSYKIYGIGKIFHAFTGTSEDWDVYKHFESSPIPDENEFPINGLEGVKSELGDWGGLNLPDSLFRAHKIATQVIEILNHHDNGPFMLAAGFRLPHKPWYVPSKFYDQYIGKNIQIPPTLIDDLNDIDSSIDTLVSPRTRFFKNYFKNDSTTWRKGIQGYLACISFVDKQIGRIIDELRESSQLENTTIILTSDHGYMIGEKERTGKSTLWEPSTRVPLIFSGNSISKGRQNSHVVSLLDLFPTITDIVGINKPSFLQGNSLFPLMHERLIKHQISPLDTFEVIQKNIGEYENFALRTNDWKYISYANKFVELYNVKNDPHEWYNLNSIGEYDNQKFKLQNALDSLINFYKLQNGIPNPFSLNLENHTLREDDSFHYNFEISSNLKNYHIVLDKSSERKGIVLNEQDKILSWQPGKENIGAHKVALYITDGENYSSNFFYINVLVNNDRNFDIYPNPSMGTIYVRFDILPTTSYQFKFRNLSGALLREIQPSTTEQIFSLDITNLEEGIYFLDIYQNNKRIASEKVLIVSN